MKFYRVKDIATALCEVAANTGYEYEYLAECFQELVDDGETAESAFQQVSDIAYEQDY